MNKTFAMLLCIILVTAGKIFADNYPVPSFEENSEWSRRNPEKDLNLDLFHRSWKDSPVTIGHGGFCEQVIFEPGDPMKPPKPGATLICLTEYSHGFLPAGEMTKPVTFPKNQTLFFVFSGEGTVTSGGKTEKIVEGSGIFLPAGVTYNFAADKDSPLEVLIFSEKISDKFVPDKEMKTGNYRDKVPGAGPFWHWSHITRGIVDGKWENPIWFGIVTLDALEIAQPHVAPIGIEEIWLQVKGRGLMYFGNRLFWHEPGEAFYIPPNYKVPHSSINYSDEPMLWMYLGIRLDNKIQITPAMKALIDSLTVSE